MRLGHGSLPCGCGLWFVLASPFLGSFIVCLDPSFFAPYRRRCRHYYLEWWGIPFVGYLQLQERRPYLFLWNGTTDFTLSHVELHQAPFYTVQMTNVNRVEVHHVTIVNRRTAEPSHSLWDLSAFNTDGIDVAGANVHIHHVDIWTQDDCIAIKDNLWNENKVTSNITVEHVRASGLGLTIGSIAGTTVQNITFRHCHLYHTVKGIYLKFRSMPTTTPSPTNSNGPIRSVIQNVTYHNITMDAPIQWPIWMGPAQQTGGTSRNLCHASPCSLCWPSLVPGQSCQAEPSGQYRNITLSHIFIQFPIHRPATWTSPGVILGGTTDDTAPPIVGLLLDTVQVQLVNLNKDNNQHTVPFVPSWDQFPIQDPLATRTIWVVQGSVVVVVLCLTLLLLLWLVPCRRSQRPWHVALARFGAGEEQQQGEEVEPHSHLERRQQQQQQQQQQEEERQPLNQRSNPDNDNPDHPENDANSTGGEPMEPTVVVITRNDQGTTPTTTTTTRNQTTNRTTAGGGGWTSVCALIITTTLVGLVTVQGVYWMWLIPQVQHPLRYFVCQGVQDGRATGPTLPVPSCVDTDTPTTMTKKETMSLEWTIQWGLWWNQGRVLLVLIVLVWIPYLFLLKRIHVFPQQQRQSLQPQTVDPNLPIPAYSDTVGDNDDDDETKDGEERHDLDEGLVENR